MKICTKCLQNKPKEAFNLKSSNNDGLAYWCRLYAQSYKKIYYNNNLDKSRNERKKWNSIHYLERKDKILAYIEANKEKITERSRERKKVNRYYFNKKERERRNSDPVFRLIKNLRTRLHHALMGNYKTGSAVKDLGCSIEELKKHLESKFQPGMTWDNYGKWHIDHIRPLSSFDLINVNDCKRACHYTNLQPLWAIDNLKKGNKNENK